MKYSKLLIAAAALFCACSLTGSLITPVSTAPSDAPATQPPLTPPTEQTTSPGTTSPGTTSPGTTATDVPTSAGTIVPSNTSAPGTETGTDDGKYIYLTFDDGPCEYTLRVLDILDRYNVRATFFTVGYFVDFHPEIVRETVKRGHFVACHTYTHDYMKCYASADAFMNEIDRWAAAYENAVGSPQTTVCVRFPGGSNTGLCKDSVRSDIKDALRKKGYMWFDWNAANNDLWPQGNVDRLPTNEYLMESYRKTMNWHRDDKNPHIVFLCHDTNSDTVEVLSLMIEDLIARGFTFRTIDRYPTGKIG